MTLSELMEQAAEDFCDFHHIHRGDKRYSKDNERIAAEATAMSYLVGGYNVIFSLGIPIFGAVLAVLKDEFSIQDAALGMFDKASEGFPDELGVDIDEYAFSMTWEELSQYLSFGELVQPIIEKAQEAGKEAFLIWSVYCAVRLRKEFYTTKKEEEEDA
jgi:hypothetical protein